MASYPVPARQVTAEIREKGSRFLALVGAAAAEEEARAVLAALARRHARHAARPCGPRWACIHSK
ncbi:MAG TPA: hypothetical protein VJA16_06845 [Thermoanaerobaculia bacterium]